MKRLVVFYTTIAVVLSAFILTGCSATYTSPLDPAAQKTTLKEASNITVDD